MLRLVFIINVLSLFLLSFSSVFAQPGDNMLAMAEEDALLALYGDEEILSIATGSYQPVAKAPAVATVITAEDIKAMGATDISEALEAVPGLHVSNSYQMATPIYTFRGIYSTFNPQVLIMVNGIPINTLFVGSPDTIWGGMPVEAVSRIEVLRGPGSAIYGADAFAGVINVITKQADEVDGLEVGVRIGSFDTDDEWFSYGGNLGGYDVAFFLEHHKTDGHQERIDADAQTFFDNLYGTSASYAPGSASTSKDNIDLHLDLSRGNWRLRAALQRNHNLGVYTGVARALDPNNRNKMERWSGDLTWHDPEFTDDWGFKAELSFLDTSAELDGGSVFQVYPPGTMVLGPVVGVLPDGLIGTPEHFERHYRAEFTAVYSGFERHLVRLGIGGHLADMHTIKQSKNFGINPATGLPIFPTVPNSPIFSVTDTPYNFMDEGNRKNHHAYIQDVWQFANDWELTVGLRYDDFSDFGDTYNPRAALVWSVTQELTAKLLYGEAFRSPAFAETRAINNPAALGNPDLGPETIKTTEMAFNYRPLDELNFDLSFFHYDWEDIIQFLPDPAPATTITAQNAGRQKGYGLEFAADWKATSDLRLRGNYAWQRSENHETHKDSGNAPHWQTYLRADWEFMPEWHLNGQFNWVGERARVEGDPRDPVDDFMTVDLTLRRTAIKQHWEVAASVRNLFNEDVREPSQSAAFLPNDLPQAGRSMFGEIRYRF